MQQERRIGISGGTFNPIHYGHLILAEQAREKFNLERVLFIPSGMPPHKNINEVIDSEHRFNMVCRAVNTNKQFEASRIEIDRNGLTYTVHTLLDLKQVYGESSRLFFIVGADVIRDLLTWREPQKVFQLCEFIAVFRPGHDKDRFMEQISFLSGKYMAKIHVMDMPMIEISSTSIRQRVREDLSIKYLVPENVEDYILKKRLYKE